jgi:hypothetical protein
MAGPLDAIVNAMMQRSQMPYPGGRTGGGPPPDNADLLRRLLPTPPPGDYRNVPLSQGGVPMSAQFATPPGGPGEYSGMGPPPRLPGGMAGTPPMGQGGMPEDMGPFPPTVHDFRQQVGRDPATDTEVGYYDAPGAEADEYAQPRSETERIFKQGREPSDEDTLNKVQRSMGSPLKWQNIDDDRQAVENDPTPENAQAFADYWDPEELGPKGKDAYMESVDQSQRPGEE